MFEMKQILQVLDLYDIQVLREIETPGSQKGMVWSGAITLSLEGLRKLKLVDGMDPVYLTDLGKQVLKEIDD